MNKGRRRNHLLPLLGVTCVVALALVTSVPGSSSAQVLPPDPPVPMAPLSSVPVPGPSAAELAKYLKPGTSANEAAIRLGKALFWETQLGSDGKTACASCHFKAGADDRAKNQVSPGLLRRTSNLQSADPDNDFDVVIAPNATLKKADFPFTKHVDPEDPSSPRIGDGANDVSSSQGVFNEAFIDPPTAPSLVDDCMTVTDPVFHALSPSGQVNTRKVEPRNTPSTINAVFNFRNFWDGRANQQFNAANPFGERSSKAKVFVNVGGVLKQKRISVPLSSLASQATGPGTSAFEMSCANRKWALIGKKLLRSTTVPLGEQFVAPTDSRLAAQSLFPAKGLSTTYTAMVKAAFKGKYWNSPTPIFIGPNAFSRSGFEFGDESMDLISSGIRPRDSFSTGGGTFSQIEANMPFFFGLAVQLYEQTLVADKTPVDKMLEGDPTEVDALEAPPNNMQIRLGKMLFEGDGKCINCHGGGELTNASVRNVTNERTERMIMGDGSCAIYDNGFYNIGVRPTREDVGVGGSDPFGDPLSETGMSMLGDPNFFDNTLQPPLGQVPECDSNAAVNGNFKTPQLRNLLLTGPYFHNGGNLTLRQVVNFYNRGGDFSGSNENLPDMDPDIQVLGFTPQQKTALVDFLAFGLLDDRVAREKAPFDHPSICVQDGQTGNEFTVSDGGDGKAGDDQRCIDEVGAGGNPTPLEPFLGANPQDS